jgi:hypothetical protein
MASQVLTDCKLWLAGFDLSGRLNALGLQVASELQDATTFGNDTRIHTGGLQTIQAQHEGYWEGGADKVDEVLFSRIGTQSVPMTACPTAGADGETAFTFRSTLSEYTPRGVVGELFAFGVSGQGAAGEPLVRGTVLLNGTKAASGTGTAFNLGSVPAGKSVYGALHVFGGSGTAPTLDVKVQSDDGSGFLSPIDRLTFAQQTGKGSDWQSAAGAITDTWWRISYAIGGTTPSFPFLVVVGIR